MENLLKVDDLKTYFKTHIGDVHNEAFGEQCSYNFQENNI